MKPLPRPPASLSATEAMWWQRIMAELVRINVLDMARGRGAYMRAARVCAVHGAAVESHDALRPLWLGAVARAAVLFADHPSREHILSEVHAAYYDDDWAGAVARLSRFGLTLTGDRVTPDPDCVPISAVED